MFKLFVGRKFLRAAEIGPQNGGLGEKGVQMLNFGFATQKRHILTQKRVFWCILRRCPWWHRGCGWEEVPRPPQKIAE